MFDPSDGLLTAESQQVFIVYPARLTEPQKHELVAPFVFGELFAEVADDAADVAVNVARVRESALADERMRAEAEAVIVLPSPVAKVVSRLFGGPRKIADFVLGTQRLEASPPSRHRVR